MTDPIREAHRQTAEQLAALLPSGQLNTRVIERMRMVAGTAIAVTTAVLAGLSPAPHAKAFDLTQAERQAAIHGARQVGSQAGYGRGYEESRIGGAAAEAAARSAMGVPQDYQRTGAEIGAAGGSLAGSRMSGQGHYGVGSVIGGLVGGIVGGVAGRVMEQQQRTPQPRAVFTGGDPQGGTARHDPGAGRSQAHIPQRPMRLSRNGHHVVAPEESYLPPVVVNAIRSSGQEVILGGARDIESDPANKRHMERATDTLVVAGNLYRGAQERLREASKLTGQDGLRARNTAAADLVDAESGIRGAAQDWIRVSNVITDEGFNVARYHDRIKRAMADLDPGSGYGVTRANNVHATPVHVHPR